MIIENPDTFKSWLTSILEPLCDADPAALAKYVYALVKKEKPIEELREGMLDQLDVFLQQETKPFVDMLFTSLETCEYLKSAVPAAVDQKQPSPSPQPHEDMEKVDEVEPEVEEPQATTVTMNGTSEDRPTSPDRDRVVLSRNVRPRPPQEQTLVKVLPLNELLDEPLDPEPKRRDRRMPDSLRDKEDRRRRPRGWVRRNRRRDEPIRHDVRRPGSRSPSPRRGYRNRSPPPMVDRPLSRSRSRSPLPPPRKRVHERLERRRSLSRDRASRDRDHRERAIVPPRERSRSRSLTPIDDRDRLSPVGPAYKRRCRDFDVKGYCMRGDLCVWDHGTDPLVLEDTTLSRALTIPPPPPPEYNPMSPAIWSAFGAAPPPPPPGGFAPPRPHPAHPHPPPHPHPAHPHPHPHLGAGPLPPHPGMPLPPRALVPLPRIRESVPPHMMHQMPPRLPPPNKKNFDFTRLGGSRPPLSQNQANCSLEVKKVPRGLNDITHLNNHFSKFGKIVNIQVSYEGDPEAALITFSNHIEANIAYKSTEAVLNNRFIKVFWHNHESKQENVPPPSAKIPERPASQHPDSNNKQLINNNNVKATEDARGPVTPATVDKPKEQPTNGQVYSLVKKEPTKPHDKSRQVMEMHKRAQTLLETQLQQQTLLINKLESGQVTGPQKAALMEAINSAQEGIEKLRKELVAYNAMIQQIKANASRPKTREEAQKEILDAELDMFTKQQEGQDVSELAKRIADLRRAMSIQFPTHPPVRRPLHGRGGGRFNTATRFVRNNVTAATPKVFNNQSVDHRPRALLVSGFEADEVDGLVKHFTQFGEITAKELNLAVPEFTVQFKARGMAEQAILRGKHYNERTLTITWVTSNKPITPVTPAPQGQTAPQSNAVVNGSGHEPSAKEIQQSPQTSMITEDTLLRFDEEEDEDHEEDRSWRR